MQTNEGATQENHGEEEEAVGAGAGAGDEVIELWRFVFAAPIFRYGTGDIAVAGVEIADGSRAEIMWAVDLGAAVPGDRALYCIVIPDMALS